LRSEKREVEKSEEEEKRREEKLKKYRIIIMTSPLSASERGPGVR